jgi:hypothetical protein
MTSDRPCADCGVDALSLGEWYMVWDEIWDRAWINRSRPPAGGILCIGCLETRLGRTLTAPDFTDAPISIPLKSVMSKRLRNRLTTGLTAAMIKRRVGPNPDGARAAFRAAMNEPRCDYCGREDADGNPIQFAAIGSPNSDVVENAHLHRKCERPYLRMLGPEHVR